MTERHRQRKSESKPELIKDRVVEVCLSIGETEKKDREGKTE